MGSTKSQSYNEHSQPSIEGTSPWWPCHNCGEHTALQVELSVPNVNITDENSTLDDVQTCVSYECKSCGSEEMSYRDLYGGADFTTHKITR